MTDWQEGFFKPGEQAAKDSPRGYAILAIKRELLWLGTGRRVNDTHASYGNAMAQAVKDFQAAAGLIPDAVIGPRTCKALFNSRSKVAETAWEIPNRYVCRLLDLESAWYPASRNDAGDTGLAQINLPAHPSVSLEEAYDPAFSIPWAAERLSGAHTELARRFPKQSWTRRWWAALFAHNAPAFADDWLEAGCPATGGPDLMVAGKQWDAWEWATLYVTVILNRSC